MNLKFKYEWLEYCLIVILLFVSFTGIVHATDQLKEKNQKIEGLQVIIKKVKEAVRTKNFMVLKKYVLKKEPLYWVPCGAYDLEPEEIEKLSFEAMTSRLLGNSKGEEIYVHGEPDISPGNLEKTIFTITIDTVGWISEYPYLSFNFIFTMADKRWEWRGVCDSAGPLFRFSKDSKKYEEIYYREPKLPRPGPRIFSHYSTLRARIAEIVKFREFEALRPYAIKGTIVFEQCSRKIMEKNRVEGKEKSVDDVINFLKKRAIDAKEIKFSGVSHNTHYETVGWSGEYPVIAFWFNESKDGWEWAGITYCKTKHLGVLFPEEPTFK